jgi:hypothetical protein
MINAFIGFSFLFQYLQPFIKGHTPPASVTFITTGENIGKIIFPSPGTGGTGSRISEGADSEDETFSPPLTQAKPLDLANLNPFQQISSGFYDNRRRESEFPREPALAPNGLLCNPPFLS